MRGKLWTVVLGLLVLGLLTVNLQLASAHRWGDWHWNKKTIKVRNTSNFHAEAEAAINDWDSRTKLKLPRRSKHTNISVFDGNYGKTGWGGLASIKNTGWDWWCWWWCKVTHGHARYNSYYKNVTKGTGSNSDIRGIFCQEIGHLFGLGHSNDGCMGKGYFNNLNVVSSHNAKNVNSYTH